MTAEFPADFRDGILTLRAAGLERRIDFSAGAPRTLSLLMPDGIAAGENPGFDADIAGLEVLSEPRSKADVPQIVRHEILSAPAYDGNALYAEVETYEPYRKIRRLYRYILYPGLTMTGFEMEITSPVTPRLFLPPRLAAEERAAGKLPAVSVLDTLTMPEVPEDVTAAEFRMRTDYTNDLVRYHAPAPDGTLPGNILEWRSGNHRFVTFQEAPPANERQNDADFDFIVKDGTVKSCGAGFLPQEVTPGRTLCTHRNWTGIAGDTAELVRRFFLARLPEVRRSRYAVTANPWGSRYFYERINRDFLIREVQSAARAGADLYQIDDGYQEGGTLGDLSAWNRPLDHDFWTPDPEKFPEGFGPVVEAAGKSGVAVSYWFAANTNREFEDWEDSAEILLEAYRKHGFKVFKLDGVRFTSFRAEENFVKLLRKLYTGSNGEITVNLDVTNGVRGGVCYLTNFGTLFLENRYVGWPMVMAYHPVDTLGNLWKLARYIPACNLQIEVPSIAEIKREVYARPGMPPVPDEYNFRFWLGVSLFASPLLWFQPSMQPENVLRESAEVMAVHRKYREQLFAGTVRPVGGEPGKGELTGFYASTGFAVVYRTLNAPDSARIVPEHGSSELLYATGPAQLLPDGTARLEEPGTFAFWRIG